MLIDMLRRIRLARQRVQVGRFSQLHYDTTSAEGQLNRQELCVFGLRRSGNHAIINWILANQYGIVFFLNNIRTEKHFNPYVAFGRAYMKTGDVTIHLQPRRPWANVKRAYQLRSQHQTRDCMICSYEDHRLVGAYLDAVEASHDQWLGQSEQFYKLLILRDPFNCFASRIRSGIGVDAGIVDLWKVYAKEFVGDTHTLGDNKITVSYNQWFADESYRRELAQKLGLATANEGLDRVMVIGGGSSFDATALDGKGRQMKVLERWKSMLDSRSFVNLFQDEELMHLAERAFGRLPDVEILNRQ